MDSYKGIRCFPSIILHNDLCPIVLWDRCFPMYSHCMVILGSALTLWLKNLNLQPKMTRLDPTMAEVPMSKTSYVTFLSPFSLTGPSLRD